MDLYSSVKLFEKPENKLYLKYFTKLLKEDIEFMQKTFKDFPNVELPENMTLTDFNNLFIVPFFEYSDVLFNNLIFVLTQHLYRTGNFLIR